MLDQHPPAPPGSSFSSSLSSLSSFPPLPPSDQSLTQEKQRQMFQEPTAAFSPTPKHLPFVLDQQLTSGKNWPYKHAHPYTKNTAAQICKGSTVVPNEWTMHTRTHTSYKPSAIQIPSVSLIVATLGSGLVSAPMAQSLSGQLAWLILLLQAAGSQTKGQRTPGGGHRAGNSGNRECVICLNCVCVCVCFNPINLKH